MQPIFFPEISVRGNHKLQNQLLFGYWYIHRTVVPREVTQDSYKVTQRMRITRSVIHSCQTMIDYAVLKFLDVSRVNVFLIYLFNA